MTTLKPHEIADLRAEADRGDWHLGQQLHALLDAYEDMHDEHGALEELKSKCRDIADIVAEFEKPDADKLKAVGGLCEDAANTIAEVRGVLDEIAEDIKA
jgi:hypothetical protein